MKQCNMLRMKLSELVPADYNPREITDRALEGLGNSIERFGLVQPIVWNKRSGRIVGGHQRFKVLMAKGITETEVVVVDLDENDEMALNVALNNPAIQGDWDNDKIEEVLRAIHTDSRDLFGQLRMDDLADKLKVSLSEQARKDPNDVPGVPKVAVSMPGKLYSLGVHRLVCGDSTKAESLLKVMGGKQADMLLTDPPYNVGYVGGTKEALTIQNDSMSEANFIAFLTDAFKAADAVMRPGAAFYIWYASVETYSNFVACKNVNWKVRQILIWVKSQLVMGRKDYHFRHEPCQPAGAMITTPDGLVPIERLKNGDKVVSFSEKTGTVTGLRDGRSITTAKRRYCGDIYEVSVAGKTTRTTDNHEFTVRFNRSMSEYYCTYLMRRGGWWRIGMSKMFNSRGFGVGIRLLDEDGDEAWILDVHQDRTDAICSEQVFSCKYGIPTTHWSIDKYTQHAWKMRTSEQITRIYDRLDLDSMRLSAGKLLADLGRRMEYPLVVADGAIHSRRTTSRIRACNLIPKVMELPIPTRLAAGKRCKIPRDEYCWCSIESIRRSSFDGDVFSMDVEIDHHYIADGVVVRNCLYGWRNCGEGFQCAQPSYDDVNENALYGWKEGSHLWLGGRKQTTVLEFNKPLANAEHPTMKPVELFERLIWNNTRRGGLVLDAFCGSGTTIIAAEKSERIGFGVELDPLYCDVIRRRWAEYVHGDGCDWQKLTPEVTQ